MYTRDGHSDYGHAFVSFMDNWPNVLSPRSSLLVLGDGRNNYRNPEIDLLAHMVNASRHAHWLNPEPRHLWGSGDSAVPRYRGRHHHARMPVGQAAGLGDRRAAAGLSCPWQRNRRSAEEVRVGVCKTWISLELLEPCAAGLSCPYLSRKLAHSWLLDAGWA